MNQFAQIKLSSVANVISGYAFKSEDLTKNKMDIPVLKIANVTPPVTTLVFEDHFPREKISARIAKYIIRDGDVLVAMTGMGSVGRVSIVRGIRETVLLNQRVGIVRGKQNVFDQQFLGCVLTNKHYEKTLYDLGVGAGQPNISPKDIGNLSVSLPPLVVQKKIAAILTAYDELIENNQRRIALLEKMAEEIYREWFVRLRFPGHEKVKIIKGVPEDWKLVKLESAFKFTGGGTPTKEVNRYWDGGDVNWFTPSDITGANGIFLEQSGEQCTEEGLNNSSAKMFPAYSVMLTSRATIGAIGINLTPACTNQGFITCIPNAQYPLPYLYHWIKLAKPHFELLSGGATFAELTKGTFKRIEILTPPESIITEFVRIESPLFKVIENHLRANSKLIETRDKLLPRLISGKLSVEMLDIQFPPGMEESAHAD